MVVNSDTKYDSHVIGKNAYNCQCLSFLVGRGGFKSAGDVLSEIAMIG